LGLLIFWNILIPVAPALLVVATGLWRNVCPMATTVLLPRRFNLSKRKIMPAQTQAVLQVIAVIALYMIVPLRHAVFNRSGMSTAILLFAATSIGFTMGFIYDWKSGWCASLCPIHPVEKLYGGNTIASLPNAHCHKCVNCSIPCPDSTPNIHPAMSKKTSGNKISGVLTIGGLPGFIWGWFHVPDRTTTVSFHNFLDAYRMPFTGFAITLFIYLTLTRFIKAKHERIIVNFFAATAVSCYYFYRIPSLLGFGKYADDGLLINLKNILPQWSILLLVSVVTIFFFWWIVFRKSGHQSWVIRPEFSKS
jgi:hypothetical protein